MTTSAIPATDLTRSAVATIGEEKIEPLFIAHITQDRNPLPSVAEQHHQL